MSQAFHPQNLVENRWMTRGSERGSEFGREAARRAGAARHRDAGDANPNGDIFGGWLLAQMDLAGGSAAAQRARGRVATIAITAMTFYRPSSSATR